MKLIKKYELIFLKMRQPYKKQKKLLSNNTNKEAIQDKESNEIMYYRVILFIPIVCVQNKKMSSPFIVT